MKASPTVVYLCSKQYWPQKFSITRTLVARSTVPIALKQLQATTLLALLAK